MRRIRRFLVNFFDNVLTYLVAGFIGYGFAEWFDGTDLDMWIYYNLDSELYGCVFVAITIAVGMTVTCLASDVIITYIRAKMKKNIDV